MKKLMGMVLVSFVLASVVACGSDGDGVDVERGPYSIKVTILGVQDCGYVTHNLGDVELYRGTDIWDFTKDLVVTLQAYDGSGCVFQSWGDDCAFADGNHECGPLTMDRQYDVTATFVAP
jgi:hypothetical protein